MNLQNSGGVTALMRASEEGRTEIVNLIKDHPNYIKKLFEHTYTVYDLITMPMWEATELLIRQTMSKKPDMDLVRDLFEYAVLDVNQEYGIGITMLNCASWENHVEIVKTLLERPEIDVNQRDKDGWTALMLASANGCIEVVKLLLEHPKIDVNVQDGMGVNVLRVAIVHKHTEIASLIHSHPNFKETL